MQHTDHHEHHMMAGESSAIEYFKFALVLVGIGLSAWWLKGHGDTQAYLRWFMGIFFVVFAGFKLIGYAMFSMMFATYDIVAKRFKVYASLYPFIELSLGLLYVLDVIPVFRDILTVAIMAIGGVGVFQEIKKRSGIHCACLGNIIKLPLSSVSLVEDIGMGLMALYMLFF